jgi:malonyl-CoA O-methyltransferase
MSSDNEYSLDHRALRRAFDRAAADCDASFVPLQRMNAELLERLKYFSLDPQFILDLGAGTCGASLALRESFPRAQIVALDFSLPMLQGARHSWWPRGRFHRVMADAVRLPLVDHSVDLVYSNLLLPFCDRPHLVFRELARVLKEGGLLVFSSMGPDTLTELREAWRCVDDGAHVSQFLNLPQMGDALMHSGLTEPVMDTEHHSLEFQDVGALMQALKRLGAQNATSARSRGLTGRGRMRAMIDAYESARTPAGLPATFEVIFGAAFAAGRAELGPAATEPGEVAIPLSALKKRS